MKIQAYEKAERIKEERNDTHMWMMGAYVFEAISTALSNAFRKKGSRARPFRDQPYMMEVKAERGELTTEEKIEKTETVFKMLQIMQANYELEQKFKERPVIEASAE